MKIEHRGIRIREIFSGTPEEIEIGPNGKTVKLYLVSDGGEECSVTFNDRTFGIFLAALQRAEGERRGLDPLAGQKQNGSEAP